MTGHVLHGTSIAVDYWSQDLGKTYLRFLTHSHNDKIDGLSLCYKEYIHTSPFNAWILETKIKVDPTYIVPLDLDKPHVIHDKSTDSKFNVTLMDSNHCPGSVMFLFQGSFGNYLYTGHFCWNPVIMDNPMLKSIVDNKSLDYLYLDNTYAAKHCQFPPKYKVLKDILKLIRGRKYYQVIIGLHTLGKEEVLEIIASKIKEMIHVSQQRFDVVNWLKLKKVFTTDKRFCRIFAVDMHTINIHDIIKRQKMKGPILTLLLTGLHAALPKEALKPYSGFGKFGVHVLPYSDHSSHQELFKFVSFLRPNQIVPIVEFKTPWSPINLHTVQIWKNSLIPKNILALRRDTSQYCSVDTKFNFSPPDGSLVNNTVETSISELAFKRKQLLDSLSVPYKIKKRSNNLSDSVQNERNDLLDKDHRVGTLESIETSAGCTDTVSKKICEEQEESGTNLVNDIHKGSNLETENSDIYTILNDLLTINIDLLEQKKNIESNSDFTKTLKNNTQMTEHGIIETNADCLSGLGTLGSSASSQIIETKLDSVFDIDQGYISDPISINVVVDPSFDTIDFSNTTEGKNDYTSKLNEMLKHNDTNAPIYQDIQSMGTVSNNKYCEKGCSNAEVIKESSFEMTDDTESEDSISILYEYKVEKVTSNNPGNSSDVDARDVLHIQMKEDMNDEESATDENYLANYTNMNIECTENIPSEETSIFPIYSHGLNMNKNSCNFKVKNITASKETLAHNYNSVHENIIKSNNHEVQKYGAGIYSNFNNSGHLNINKNRQEEQSRSSEVAICLTNNSKLSAVVDEKNCELQREERKILSNIECPTKISKSIDVHSTDSEDTVICLTNNYKLPAVINNKNYKGQREERKILSIKQSPTKNSKSIDVYSTDSEDTVICHTNNYKLPAVVNNKHYKGQREERKILSNKQSPIKNSKSCEVHDTASEDTVICLTNNYKLPAVVNNKHCKGQREERKILSNKQSPTKNSQSIDVHSTDSEDTVICLTNNYKLPAVVNNKHCKGQREERKILSSIECLTKNSKSCEVHDTASEDTVICLTNNSKLAAVVNNKYCKGQKEERKILSNIEYCPTNDSNSSGVQSTISSEETIIHYKNKNLHSGMMECKNCDVQSAITKNLYKYVPYDRRKQRQKQVYNKTNSKHYNDEGVLNKWSRTKNADHKVEQDKPAIINLHTHGHSQPKNMLAAYNCKLNHNSRGTCNVLNSFATHLEPGNYMRCDNIKHSQTKKTLNSNHTFSFWNHVPCKELFSLPFLNNKDQ